MKDSNEVYGILKIVDRFFYNFNPIQKSMRVKASFDNY